MVRVWDNPDSTNVQDRITFRTTYDSLHRPLETFVEQGNAAEICFAKTVYGESITPLNSSFTQAQIDALNIKGQAFESYDQSGKITSMGFDFKGNPLLVTRQLVSDYINNIDWNGSPTLEADVFETSSTYDALNRPKQTILPDNSIVLPTYNLGGYLDNLQVDIMGLGNPVDFMKGQDFDAKGQRQYVKYGNDTITKFFYDANTFRLTNLLTTHHNNAPLQDLHYTYDPVGNITEVVDDAQQTYFFQNNVVQPLKKYNYDALYRLKKATGREHANTGAPHHEDLAHLSGIPSANSVAAVQNYTQYYDYDKVGNISKVKHIRASGGSWTRTYFYDHNNANNQLLRTNIGGLNYLYEYDNAHGNMTKMPHLQALTWNFQDQLRVVELNTSGDMAYYNYDGSGQRVRKVVKKGNKITERLYLGGVERYREYSSTSNHNNNTAQLERWTLQVEDIAQVDTLTIDNNSTVANPTPLIRYQYKDHLGSASLETNELAQVISYEEYHPFGTSSYRVAQSGTDLSLKRYRFTGKERDDETGLYYFGVRYYAAWLGRWTSTDPGGFVDGLNLYVYVRNNPVNGVDELGYETEPPPDCRDCPDAGYWAETHGDRRFLSSDGHEYFAANKAGGGFEWIQKRNITISELDLPSNISSSPPQRSTAPISTITPESIPEIAPTPETVAPVAPPVAENSSIGGLLGGIVLDVADIVLTVVGFVPGLGEFADWASAALSAARGDVLGAALSAAAMIPFAGWLAGFGKIGKKLTDIGDKVVDIGNKILEKGDEWFGAVLDWGAGWFGKKGGVELAPAGAGRTNPPLSKVEDEHVMKFDEDELEAFEEAANKKFKKKKNKKHREKTKNANKKDARQITDAAKEVGVDRQAFSDYLHDIKKAEGRGGSDNFKYQRLLELAEELKRNQKK